MFGILNTAVSVLMSVGLVIVFGVLAVRLRSVATLLVVIVNFILLVAFWVACVAGSPWAEHLVLAYMIWLLPMFFVTLVSMQQRDIASLRSWMQGRGCELIQAHYTARPPRSWRRSTALVLRFLARDSRGGAGCGYARTHRNPEGADAWEVVWDGEDEGQPSGS